MKKKIFIFITSLVLLSSCGFRFTWSVDSQLSIGDDANNFYRVDKDLRYTPKEVNSEIGWVTSSTVGEQKFLIVPVVLANYKNSVRYSWTEAKLNDLNTAFFGNGEGTTFESVRSYFEKSSYGQLSITGEVTDVFESSFTYDELSSYGKQSASKIIREWYSAQTNTALMRKYDTDSDGFIDNCIFIYSNEQNSNREVMPFWAWCSAEMGTPNINKPAVNNYMWASFFFMNEMYSDRYNSSKLETHTYIHETGHLLGLDDYYCYDTKNPWNAAGKLDMQSYNVGDHNAFSKLTLGWIKPYVVTGNAKITLKTSSKYPEAILINNHWNGSSYDEYLLIEYYTPFGLNEVDSQHAFNPSTKMYTNKGLRIYHVDARFVKTTVKDGYLVSSDNYVDTLTNGREYYTVVGASNSVERSYLKSNVDKYRLLHLLDQGENNKLNNGKGGTIYPNSTLWDGKKIFTPSSKFFANGIGFNDGSKIGYSISVTGLTDEECVVTIAKN